MLNASSVHEIFAEQVYPPTVNNNASFSTSTANAIYQTADGQVFSYTQVGVANAQSDTAVFVSCWFRGSR